MTEAARAADCLAQSGVVLLPTDTVLGLAARPDRPEAVARLFALKARPAARRLPVMIAGEAQLAALGVRPNGALEALLNSPLVPGALTLIAPRAPHAAPDWLAGRDELALRIPDHDLLRAVLHLSGPLFVTSANRHGAETPQSAEAAAAQLTAPPDLILPGAPGGAQPSTIVDCTARPARIARQGAIPARAIAALVELSDD